MDAPSIKLECLKLAAGKSPELDCAKVVQEAEAYWQWLTSSSDHNPSRRECTPRTS